MLHEERVGGLKLFLGQRTLPRSKPAPWLRQVRVRARDVPGVCRPQPLVYGKAARKALAALIVGWEVQFRVKQPLRRAQGVLIKIFAETEREL